MNEHFSNETAENRLILLYLFDRINLPLTDMHITKLIRETNLMNYFDMRDALVELYQSSFVSKEISDNEFFIYTITAEGKKILDTLLAMIPLGIRLRIENLAAESRKDIRTDYLILADFTPDQNQSFMVTCSAAESDFNLIKIDISVGSREDAIEICNNWKNYSSEIYPEILEALYKNRDKDKDKD